MHGDWQGFAAFEIALQFSEMLPIKELKCNF